MLLKQKGTCKIIDQDNGLYLRRMCGSSNSTSVSRTILQNGDDWKKVKILLIQKINIIATVLHGKAGKHKQS